MRFDREGLQQLRAAFTAHATFSMRTAIEAVAHNKLRASLTSLGILFGVASVIAMLAIGNGTEADLLAQMKLLGSNNIIITPIVEQKEGKAKDDDQAKKPSKFTPGLTYRDAEAIRTDIPDVDAASSEVVLNTLLTREGRHRSGKLVGVDSSYFRIMNLDVTSGSRFTTEQMDEGRSVAIIGYGVRTRFFTTQDPIGQALKVGDGWVTVVGVLADRKVAGDNAQKLGIRDANLDVYIPIKTMLLRFRNRAEITQRDIEAASNRFVNITDATPDPDAQAERTNFNQLDRIIVNVRDAAFVPQVADVARRMLERRHNTVIDFEITVPELLLKQQQHTKDIFNVVLSAIASISLIVGGIGIMNIMLASILERIKEIGVRRALGATQRDILFQFLAEAVLISVVGGTAGILVGVGFSYGIEHFASIKTIVSALSVVVAFGVSCAVGLAFGIVPAHRAAKQDPITCLRYE